MLARIECFLLFFPFSISARIIPGGLRSRSYIYEYTSMCKSVTRSKDNIVEYTIYPLNWRLHTHRHTHTHKFLLILIYFIIRTSMSVYYTCTYAIVTTTTKKKWIDLVAFVRFYSKYNMLKVSNSPGTVWYSMEFTTIRNRFYRIRHLNIIRPKFLKIEHFSFVHNTFKTWVSQ